MSIEDSKKRVEEIRRNIREGRRLKRLANNNEIPLPCIDCVSLPFCVSKLKEYDVEYQPEEIETIIIATTVFRFLVNLREKCSLINEYLFDRHYIYYDRLDNMLHYLSEIGETHEVRY